MSTAPVVLQFEVVRSVTLPFFVLEAGQTCFLRFETAIAPDTSSFSERLRASRKDAAEKPQQAPVDVANIVNLQTGEECRMIVHSVLKSTLTEAYPSDGYVKKCFRITKSADKKGRGANKYFSFDVTEIRLKNQPNGQATETSSTPANVSAPAQQARSAARR